MQGHDVDSPGPSEGTIVVTTTGTGIGTHLGDFSFTQVVTVTSADLTDTGFCSLGRRQWRQYRYDIGRIG